ncbi:hypothetical protein BGZ70_003085, partial [Mortierella alpina]
MLYSFRSPAFKLFAKSTAYSVFATPQLLLLISAYLDPVDLADCNAVCKAWRRWFEPILWTNVCLDNGCRETLSDELKGSLTRNLPHIRTLKSFYASLALLQVLTHGSATPCPNLKRLEFDLVHYEQLDLTLKLMPTLLNRNRQLTHLAIPFEFIGFAQEDQDAVLTAISKLENLQRLKVDSLEEWEYDGSMPLLLQACLPLPKLTELFLDTNWQFNQFGDYTVDLETLIKDASKARFAHNPAATKVKSLRMPINRSGKSDPIPLLLLKSNVMDLESCQIPWFADNTDSAEIEQVVRKHCPKLKHLTCPSFKYRHEYDRSSSAFLQGCSGIKSFSSELYCDTDITSTLVSLHHNTLEVFEAKEGDYVSSNDLQAVLSQCKKLKRFWVMEPYSHKSTISITFADIAGGEWACTGLTELGLTLNRCPKDGNPWSDDESGSDDEESEDPVKAKAMAAEAKRVYAQIGRMEKLEVLELDIDVSRDTGAKEGDYAWDLTLYKDKGWLRQLAGLKNLKRLSLKADFWSQMRKREMKFILENWPSLTEIHLEGAP